ncbi:MAG: zf-HC2 domain-containing protein [bacterium]
MSSCPHDKNIISYQLGLLDNEERKRFEAHLKQCPTCQQEMQLESIVKDELSHKLEPGQIEQRVLANLRLRKNIEPRLSWLYIIRMGVYALAMITGALVFIPWLLEYPISMLFNLNINFNLLGELSAISNFLSYPYLFGVIGLIFIGVSAIYSYKLLQE